MKVKCTLKTHCDQITQTRLGDGLGHTGPHSFSSVYTTVSWATLKDHLINWHPLYKKNSVLICMPSASYFRFDYIIYTQEVPCCPLPLKNNTTFGLCKWKWCMRLFAYSVGKWDPVTSGHLRHMWWCQMWTVVHLLMPGVNRATVTKPGSGVPYLLHIFVFSLLLAFSNELIS